MCSIYVLHSPDLRKLFFVLEQLNKKDGYVLLTMPAKCACTVCYTGSGGLRQSDWGTDFWNMASVSREGILEWTVHSTFPSAVFINISRHCILIYNLIRDGTIRWPRVIIYTEEVTMVAGTACQHASHECYKLVQQDSGVAISIIYLRYFRQTNNAWELTFSDYDLLDGILGDSQSDLSCLPPQEDGRCW